MAMNKFCEAFEAAQLSVKNEKFPADWAGVIGKAKLLLAGSDGPDPVQQIALQDLRKKLEDGALPKVGQVGAKASAQITEAARDTNAINTQRAATLKMLKHLYLAGEGGNQTLWVYSPPRSYTQWIFDEIANQPETVILSRLEQEQELYTADHRRVMAEAAQQARAACGKVQAELGVKAGATSIEGRTAELVQKWFFGDTAPDESAMNDAITKLRNGFRDIAAALAQGQVIFSDEPTYRALPGKWQNFGMIRPSEKMMVIYMMKGFLDEAGKPKAADRWLCVETIIHELSHKVVKTGDYAYDFHGLKPGAANFSAGAALHNADNWGYFACELNGILPSSEEAKVYKIPSKVLKAWAG